MNRFHAVRCQSIVAATLLVAAGGLFAAPAARADFPLPLPHEIHREVRAHVHEALRTLGRIPAEIHRSHVRNLEVFLGGNAYYAPHRHHHATYNFPVSVDGGVVYRSYSYCNNRLYGSYASRPQFWMGWGVPSQGHWCSSHRSYYPTAHSCFRRPSRSHGYDSYPRGYRSDSYGHHDRGYRNERDERGYRSSQSHRNDRSYRGKRGDQQHRHDRSCRHDRRDRD
jgi:hypothetical protein